jgi:peptidoglycan/LPS O-acetylase OafA/YrhL
MNLNYRPEINGLKAIAIISVIIYHAQINLFNELIFKGGFLGIDIFFVISGYLVSLSIFSNFYKTGTFKFITFISNRLKRILPNLLFVLVISVLIAWFALSPNDLINFSKSLISSIAFNSNFYFHFAGNAFGEYNSLTKPLLHTWSLSVLVQFYLIFSLCLLLIFRFFTKYLIHILFLLFLISFIFADFYSKNYPSLSFYILPTRFWELILGSLLAYFELKSSDRNTKKKINIIMPFVGLTLISISLFFFNDQMFYPSFFTLVPIFGVCLIIWFSNKEGIFTKLLSGIGLISYSLYLWHYPIFAYARSSGLIQGSGSNKILIALLVILLSLISYFLIEKKTIKRKYSLKSFFNYLLLASIILVLINFMIIKHNGFTNRVPEIIGKNINYISPASALKNQNGEECFNNLEGCKFNINGLKTIFAIGDSHMSALSYNLKDRVIKKNYSFVTSVYGNCLYFPGFDKYYKKTNKISDKCLNSYFLDLEKKLLNENNSIVIFGGRFPLFIEKSYFDNLEGGKEKKDLSWLHEMRPVGNYKNIEESFKDSVKKISKNGNKIILIYPIPEAGWNIPNKIFKDFFIFKKNLVQENYIHTSYEAYINRTKSSFKLLDSIKGKNIYRVYPHKLFCNTIIKDRCITHNKNDIFYFDSHHVSSKGSELINDLILKKIAEIEKN